MADATTEKNTDDDVPAQKKLDDLYELIDEIEVASLVTQTSRGSLVSRPMQTQEHRPGVDVWFMTSVESGKIDEIKANAEVNLTYNSERTKEWISISGTATLSQDNHRIRELYRPSWKAWFENQGGALGGGPNDPRIVLIEVDAHEVTYFKVDEPRPVVLFQIAKAMLTKSVPDLGSLRHLGESELR